MQLGLCPEAASHLQELKDNLIAISNELLDNGENLNSVQIAKLRHDRCVFPLEVHPVYSIFIFNIFHTQSKEKGQRLYHRIFFILYNNAESLYFKNIVTPYSF